MVMAHRVRIILLASLVVLVGTPKNAFAACDQTLSVGANIASAVSSAANGSTICLNNGNFGTVNLTNISRSGPVTLRSTSGIGAQMSPQVTNSKFITFSSLTLTNMDVQSCSVSIYILDSTFVPNAPGLYFFNTNTCGGNQDLRVDNVRFAGVDQGGNEGRLGTEGPINGLTVTRSFFGNNGYGDGIQLGGGVPGTVVIGPGNVFDGVSQSYCDAHGGAHCDALQCFGGCQGTVIKQNMFRNGLTYIMAPDQDNKTGLQVIDNIFDHTWDNGSYFASIQIFSADNLLFAHNTVVLNDVFVGTNNPGWPNSNNVVVRNNIIINGTIDNKLNGCVSCTFQFNLFKSSGSAVGTNNVIGTPIFIGGTYPLTWAGWQLVPTSPGASVGNDGKDMGTTYYGAVTGTVPTAPANLRIISN